YPAQPKLSSCRAGGLSPGLRNFARRGDRAAQQRIVSEPPASEGTVAPKLFPLDHQCAYRIYVSTTCKVFWRISVRPICNHDGGAVFRRVVLLPGDEGSHPGADAAPPGH